MMYETKDLKALFSTTSNGAPTFPQIDKRNAANEII